MANEPRDHASASDPTRDGQKRVVHDQSLHPAAAPASRGSAEPETEPQLPQDIDQSAHSQASASATHVDVGLQAHADQTGASRDTDRGPVLDEVYNRTLAPDRGETPPRR
ncbi:MAG: hypothetical protein ACTHL8_06225 [Burkholderiaceae bacterium]